MHKEKTDVGSDFATVLSRAQDLPSPDPDGRDLADTFPFSPPPHHNVVDSKDEDPRAIQGITKYRFRVHHRVFTLWRPWDSCGRCKDAIANGQAILPDVGDYCCPHNERSDYEKTANDILAARLLVGSEQEVVTRDGSIVISLRWYEPIPGKKERREAAKARALGRDGPPSP